MEISHIINGGNPAGIVGSKIFWLSKKFQPKARNRINIDKTTSVGILSLKDVEYNISVEMLTT